MPRSSPSPSTSSGILAGASVAAAVIAGVGLGAFYAEGEGLRPAMLLLVPIGLTAVGLNRRKDLKVMSAIFLWGFCLVSIWSLGLYLVPAALLLTASAITASPGPGTG